jgi:hypothetical protein
MKSLYEPLGDTKAIDFRVQWDTRLVPAVAPLREPDLIGWSDKGRRLGASRESITAT